MIITLTNGKKVANFSSPHPFKFTDGTILPAVNNKYALLMQVNFMEEDMGRGDVKLSFTINDIVIKVVKEWHKKYSASEVDVVFIPLPMLYALYHIKYNVRNSPFRVIRVEDRINKLVSITKQCL